MIFVFLCLISLSMIISRSVHVAKNGIISFSSVEALLILIRCPTSQCCFLQCVGVMVSSGGLQLLDVLGYRCQEPACVQALISVSFGVWKTWVRTT